MIFSRQTPVLSKPSQMIIRITVPWYEPFDVETKYYGTFKVQLASVAAEDTTLIQITGVRIKTKHTPKQLVSETCGLSGAFETQVQAIQGWEEGFVVMALDDEELAPVADALVKAMLKKGRASIVTIETSTDS